MTPGLSYLQPHRKILFRTQSFGAFKSGSLNRKVAGILLFFCLAVPLAATLTFLYYQKKQVRKEVKRQIIAGIDQEDLVLLKFTQAAAHTLLKWEHAEEFEYNDQMYDVVSLDVRGDTIYYWCWWDNAENKLNKQLDELLAYALGTDTPQQEEQQKRLTNFYTSLFCESLPERDILTACKTARVTIPYTVAYSTVFFPPPFPPPRA